MYRARLQPVLGIRHAWWGKARARDRRAEPRRRRASRPRSAAALSVRRRDIDDELSRATVAAQRHRKKKNAAGPQARVRWPLDPEEEEGQQPHAQAG